MLLLYSLEYNRIVQIKQEFFCIDRPLQAGVVRKTINNSVQLFTVIHHSNRVVLATSNSRLFHKKIMNMVTVFSFSINIYLGNQQYTFKSVDLLVSKFNEFQCTISNFGQIIFSIVLGMDFFIYHVLGNKKFRQTAFIFDFRHITHSLPQMKL